MPRLTAYEIPATTFRCFLLSLLLCLGGASACAQVAERWHVRLTEPDANEPFSNRSAHSLNAMALDQGGSIYLAGQVSSPFNEGYLAKCSHEGQLLWQTNWYGVQMDSLAVAADGSAVVSGHNISDLTASLMKLDPAGNEVWRAVPENSAVADGHVTSLAQNAQGDIFWLTVVRTSESGGNSGETEVRVAWIVSKFNKEGQRLWRTELPGGHLLDVDGGLRGSLAATSDGGVALASVRCTRLNADGTVRWTVLPATALNDNGIFSTAAVGTSDSVLAGRALISASGQATSTGWPSESTRVIGYIPGQGFLTSVASAVWCIDDQGAVRWRTWVGNGFGYGIGIYQAVDFALAPSGDGWFAFAGDIQGGVGMTLWRFENDGRLRWRKTWPNLNSDCVRLAVVPDGTVVVALANHDIFGNYRPLDLFSFTVAEDSDAPGITHSPASAGWDAVTPLTLSVDAVGQSLSYQWRRSWQVCDGETNSSIVIRPRPTEFAMPGEYWCVVSNGHGTAASRMANVPLTQPRILTYFNPDGSPAVPPSPVALALAFESDSEIARPFEFSTNLVDWQVGPAVTNWGGGYSGSLLAILPVPVSGSDREYYRLRPPETATEQKAGPQVLSR